MLSNYFEIVTNCSKNGILHNIHKIVLFFFEKLIDKPMELYYNRVTKTYKEGANYA